MKQLFLMSLVLGLLISGVQAQNNSGSGFLLVEQWPGGMSYTGGIYFPNGVTIQTQFAGFELNWFVIGYSAEINGLYVEVNGGAVVGRSDSEIYNLSFQCNLSYGNNKSRLNLLACSEYDPSVKKNNPNLVWAFHQYLIRAGKVHLGICAELNGEISKDGNSFHLAPGPMIKYWLNNDIAFLFSPRGSVILEKNTELNQGSIYIGCLWLFDF